jgi:uncharacterized protein
MLYLKKSLLPGAGKGLFTGKDVKKGQEVVEYEGEIVPWSVVEERSAKGHEGYAFYISERTSVDAYFTPWALGRYANDAKGFGRVEGLRNNSQYIVKRKKGVRKVFIVASRSIKAGSEILVDYGADYWRYLNHQPKKPKKSKTAAKKKK